VRLLNASLLLSAWIGFVFSGGCGPAPKPADKPIETVGGAKKASTAGEPSATKRAQTGSRELKFDGISFTAPAGWKEVDIPPEKQGFIDAQFLVPTGDQELTLTLSSAGGGIESNVDRWKTQFQMAPGTNPIVEPIDVGTQKGTWVDISGTFSGGMAGKGGVQTGWRMLGVGIPAKPRDFYLKLTGPAEAVEKAREPLRAFASTARFPL
jgi:hypothetical protein